MSSQWKDKTGTCSVAIKYPQINNISDASIQTAINASIKKIFIDAVTQSQLTDEDGNPVAPNRYGYTCDFYDSASYEATLNKNNIVSFKYSYSTGYNGVTMHPLTLRSGITYDLSTGKVLNYSDLFKTDPQSMSIMESAVKVAVINEYKAPEYDKAYTDGIITSFSKYWGQNLNDIKFYLTPTQAVFFDINADPSVPTIAVDYSSIKDVILDQRI